MNVVEQANIPKFPPVHTECKLGENILGRIECLTPTVKFDILITISH